MLGRTSVKPNSDICHACEVACLLLNLKPTIIFNLPVQMPLPQEVFLLSSFWELQALKVYVQL